MAKKKDSFYRLAKDEGYRSRAAYKLLQINNRFNVIEKNDTIVDLGAAPGGWLQVARKISNNKVVGIDLQRIKSIEGVETVKGDMTSDRTVRKILKTIEDEGVDVVISDAAPNLSGNWNLDHARSIDLVESALEFAKQVLKPSGNFVVKVFQGDMFNDFLEKVKNNFAYVKAHEPKASRSQSAEIYVIGMDFLNTPVKKNEEYDVEITSIGSGGDGAVTINGFVIFVKDVDIGDRVKIKIEDVKPSFAFANVVEYL
ncbi:ribosomal RNA methyltransferase RrmJ/FtsJ [Methanohalobium evestigatum Z-7303]|uniref:Ribosomal RNA large subunit methyltransferase E n=1 Tax=Methanohalobium evestigatum (strain ATCC BAA-1072 / DSM 3721 / NBRC 107634 / OCM 161 / Z-7303) TaxID=644295 RepID=D7E8N8_METEZ|nr:23S rRNA (uridine(2552)-2'-O)-methyltransferase [Methanohalobium evestigatum]ADI73709.1 ribosomal RNA methyltransferase RrmJ/FtsJ [Methanohalobium evestigatum Z-7303]